MIEYNTHILSVTTPPSEIEYNKAIIDAYNNIIANLMGSSGAVTKAYLTVILSEFKEELLKINADFEAQITEDMEKTITIDTIGTEEELAYALAYKDITENIYKLPKSSIKKLIDIKNMTFFRVDSNGTMHETTMSASTMIHNIANDSYSKVRGVMLSEYAIGSSLETLARKIKPFATDTPKSAIRATVKTLTGEASQRSKNEFYDLNKGLIEEYLFSSVIDSRTSSLCASLDGQRFKKREPWYVPILHINCRSSLLSIPKGYTSTQRPIVDRDGNITIVNDKNFTFRDAVKMFPDLNDNTLLDINEYKQKMKYYK